MCTGLPVFVDKSLIFARTMEFGPLLDSQIHYIPAGKEFTSWLTKDADSNPVKGKSWTSKYAFMGPNAMNSDAVIEGFNEKGLHAAAFYFPDYAEFVDFPADASGCLRAVSPLDFVDLVLGTCATIDEVKDLLATTPVVASYFNGLGDVPPIHWIIQTVDGAALTVEYAQKHLNIYANHLNVITNSPSFDWHVTNLNNYVNLSPLNVNVDTSPGKLFIGLKTFGQGSGMLGLPGDFTPPSRFVRAVALAKAVEFFKPSKPTTAEAGVNLAWNLINNISIAFGTAQAVENPPGSKAPVHQDFTQWTSVSDLANLKYYIRTYDNQNIRVIDLRKLMSLPESQNKQYVPIDQPTRYIDVTDEAKPLDQAQ